MIQKLASFYLLDGKLLYVCRDFIGYDPTISTGLPFVKPEHSDTQVNTQEFELHGRKFTMILTCHIAWGPLRGFERTEILQDGGELLQVEAGSMGHGTNYGRGKSYLVKDGNAYLVGNGYAMSDYKTDRMYSNFVAENCYLFWFRNIVIPTINQSYGLIESIIADKEIYTRAEIEPLRQTEWEADAVFNDHHIHFAESSVPGFWWTSRGPDGYVEYSRNKSFSALRKMEFTMDGQYLAFEHW